MWLEPKTIVDFQEITFNPLNFYTLYYLKQSKQTKFHQNSLLLLKPQI